MIKNLLKKIYHYLIILKNYLVYFFYRIKTYIKYKLCHEKIKKNICSGGLVIDGYFGIDISTKADMVLDLDKNLLPFPSDYADTAICISAINYFTRERGEKIIKDVYRVLKKGGIARFGVQDLKTIAKKYVENDTEFFFQKNPDGRDRFRGETKCDKINSWFYGYKPVSKRGNGYMYDYETLALLFKRAGFDTIEQKNYRESHIASIEKIDNRPDQMFFLEAVK
jgi:SAM-dependent methyltransferase